MFTMQCFGLCGTIFFYFGKSISFTSRAVTIIVTALHTISKPAKFVSEDGVQACAA